MMIAPAVSGECRPGSSASRCGQADAERRCMHAHGDRGHDHQLCDRRDHQASFAATGATAFGFLNTSTFPTITNTRPINAGTVHW